MATLDRTINANADDGGSNESGDWNDDFDTTLLGDPFGEGEHTWLRFPNITIPQGATIDVAYITFQTDDSGLFDAGTIQSNIFGIDEDDHAAPTSDGTWAADHSTHTSASTVWDFSAQDSGSLQTPSIVSIVQEIVDRAGWSSGNDIGIHVDDDGTNGAGQELAANEHSSLSAASLHVEYTEGAAEQALTGSLFQNTPTFNTGTVAAGAVNLAGALFQLAPTFPTGTVAATYPLTGTLFQSAPTFFTGTAALDDSQALTGTLFQSSPTFLQGDVVRLLQELAGTLHQSTPTFFQGEVTPGEIGVVGVLFESTPSFPTGTLSPGAVGLAGSLYQLAPTFFAGRIFIVIDHPPNPSTAPLAFTPGRVTDPPKPAATTLADSKAAATTTDTSGTATPINEPGKAE